jgi:hypothetical protein
MSTKKISLYDEIIAEMREKLTSIKTDKHYDDGVFKPRGAAHHAVSSLIGQVQAIKDLRDLSKKKKKK